MPIPPDRASSATGQAAQPGKQRNRARDYAADLGCSSPELVSAFAGVDVLALEYNHDELMQRGSARPKFLMFVPDLPKTRSGKIMRRLLRDIAEGRDLGDTTTLADATVVDTIREKSGAAEE